MIDDKNDYYLDNLMNETVTHLVDGHADTAAEGLATIAEYFALAGLSIDAFLNMRMHLIDSAIRKAGCSIFIHEILKDAEKILFKQRTGTKPTIIVH